MTAVLLTPPYLQFLDDDGAPLAGGKVYTYTATGTFSVGKATYTTAAGDVEHPNPVVLDASGRPTTGNGAIWISGTYDFKVTDSLDNIIETTLNVTAFTALAASSDAYFQSFSGNGTTTAFTTSEDLGSDEKAILVWVDNGLQQNVTNGAFATDTGWTKGTGWTIAAGVATATGAISTALSQTAGIAVIPSEAYVLTYTVTRSAGGIIPSIGGTAGVERTASGTYTEVISCGTTQTLAFTGNAFTGTLDNISITVANPKGYDIQNPANYTISGTTLTFSTAPAVGMGNIYVSAPSLLVGAASSSAADAAASAADAAASAAQAAASEIAAAASVTAAAGYAAALSSTSTTSLTIGTGAKTFTTQASKQYTAGQYLIASSAASALNFMHGTVTSYSGTTLIMNITDIGGSGTLADWNISISGTQGATGAQGAAGGAIALLSTQTASNSTTIDFTSSFITSTYKEYILVILNAVPASDGAIFWLRFSQSGTFASGATDYSWTTPVQINNSSTGDTKIILTPDSGVSNTSNRSLFATIRIGDPTNATLYKLISADISFVGTAGTQYSYQTMGRFIKNTTACDGLRVVLDTGNITSGTFKLYGVN